MSAARARRERVSFAEQTAGSAPPPDSDAWRRVHRISPVLNIWHVLAIAVGAVLFNVVQALADVDEVVGFLRQNWVLVALAVLAGILLIAAIAGVYSMMAWRRMQYAVDNNAVYFHQGILTKEQRVARLNRIQAVDVVQPLLGRIFGLARIVIETAGGGDSQVKIQYLKVSEAERVRREILARASGNRQGTADPAANAASTMGSAGSAESFDETGLEPAERERPVYRVEAWLLVLSSLLDTGVIASLIGMVAMTAVFFLTPISLAGMFALIPGVLGLAGYVFGRVAGEWGLQAKVAPEGIRLRRGLLQTTSQTLPPGRIQAVRLRQGIIWRRLGWWRVQVNVAGYGSSDDDSDASSSQTVLLPVGERSTALTALWLVVRDLGVDDPRPVLDAALEGQGDAAGFLTNPERSRYLDPLAFRHFGVLITRTATIVRRGRFTRTVIVVPHERVQSVGLTQGPLERRLGLANLVSHSVPGPISDITAWHLDAARAGEALEEQAERARAARAVEAPEDWAARVGVPGARGETAEPVAPGEPAAGNPWANPRTAPEQTPQAQTAPAHTPQTPTPGAQ